VNVTQPCQTGIKNHPWNMALWDTDSVLLYKQRLSPRYLRLCLAKSRLLLMVVVTLLCWFEETPYTGMCSVSWAAWKEANTVLFRLSSWEPWGYTKSCPWNADGSLGILYAVLNIKLWLLGNIKQVYCIV
jgi:hypothetical protein